MKTLFLYSVSLVTLVAACSADRGGLTEAQILGQAPVVNRSRSGKMQTFPKGISEEEARTRLDHARDALLREDYDACLEIIRKALDDGAPDPVGRELRALQFQAKRKAVSRTVLAARALPDLDISVMGKPVRMDLLLRNVSKVPVTVSRVVPGSSPTIFFLTVTREDWDMFGNVRSETTKVMVPVDSDVVLAPGASRSIPYELETPDPRTRHSGFTILRVAGVLRPAAMKAGEHEVYSPVELTPGETRVFPPGYEPLAGDPVGNLTRAFELGAREHLMVAAGLVPPGRREEATGVLVGLLSRPPSPATITVMGALRLLTGERFANRPDAWIEWWRARNAPSGG